MTLPVGINPTEDIRLAFEKLFSTDLYKVGEVILENEDGQALMIWYNKDEGRLTWARLSPDDNIYLLNIEEAGQIFGLQNILTTVLYDLERYLTEYDSAQDAYDELCYVEAMIEEGDHIL